MDSERECIWICPELLNEQMRGKTTEEIGRCFIAAIRKINSGDFSDIPEWISVNEPEDI